VPWRLRPIWLGLLGCLLVAPAIGPRLVLDDFVLALHARAEPIAEGLPSGGGLFSFASGDRAQNRLSIEQGALLPWWCSPVLELRFFRPLSAVLHRLDAALWPDCPALMHLHSVLWLGLLIYLAARLYGRIEAGSPSAALAAALYALDDAHGPAVSWLSNRNVLIAGCFGLGALAAHARARATGHRPSRWLAPVWLACALFAGEFGLSSVGYLLAYALFLDRDRFSARARSLTPHAGVLLLWAAFYRCSGAGARSSGLYLHPLHDAGALLRALPERLLILFGAAFGPVPADLFLLDPPSSPRLWLGIAGGLLLVLGVALAGAVGSDARARFWLAGMLLSALPLTATLPTDRLLVLLDLGAMPLLARILLPWLGPSPFQVAAWRRRLAYGCFSVHAVLSPLVLPWRALQMQILARSLEQTSATLDEIPDLASRTVVIVSTPVDFYASYIQVERAWRRLPRPRHLYWLTSASSEVQWTRVDARTLQLDREQGFWSTPLERLYRRDTDSLPAGTTLPLPGMSATIERVSGAGLPASIRFRFESELESPAYVFLSWQGERFVPVHFGPPGLVRRLPAVRLLRGLAATALADVASPQRDPRP
jgi:hypothetical protein